MSAKHPNMHDSVQEPPSRKEEPDAGASYLCPNDGTILKADKAGLVCGTCSTTFSSNEYGVAQLDLLRSPQAMAFDQVYAKYDRMTDAEIERSKNLALRFLAYSGRTGTLKPCKVLDVACGKGELAVGLAVNEDIGESTLFAFDHSAGSLSALARTAVHLGVRDRLHLSQQDVSALCFPPNSFDLVCGNAVIHHFLDYPKFLQDIDRLLSPGGVAVFAEPFAEGYLLAMLVFKVAARLVGMTPDREATPAMGLYRFILDNIGQRIRSAQSPAELANLTDKHFFSTGRLVAIANTLNLKVSFENYEQPAYYQQFFDDILTTYQISDPAFVEASRRIYADLRAYMGAEFPNLFSHFRFFRLEKRRA